MYQYYGIFFTVLVRLTFGLEIHSGTFISKLNHYDTESPLINMTYSYMNEYHISDGPFYIYVKDVEEAYSTKWIESGLMAEDIVRITRGTLFTFDHRYFGSNLPVDDLSFLNMRYLSVDQILEDIATFINHIQSESPEEHNHIILWGSGTGASLATWAKVKYPQLVDATWASSGTYSLLNISTSYFYEFMEYGLTLGGTANTRCRFRVLNAFENLDQLVNSGDNGEILKSKLNLCNAVVVNSVADVAALFELYLDFITRFFQENQLSGVLSFCNAMESVPDDALLSLARWVTFIYLADIECIDHSYQTSVEHLSSVIPEPNSQRQIYYLQCTQIGLFKITYETWLPDRIPIDFHVDRCRDIFGTENIDIDALNESIDLLGNQNQDSITNTVFSNGLFDPWFNHGTISTYGLGENVTVLNIDYHFKSADLTALSDRDTILLRSAKAAITSLIIYWSY